MSEPNTDEKTADILPATGKSWADLGSSDGKLKFSLYNAAAFGWTKPAPGTKVGDRLLGFVMPDSPSFDEAFTEDLNKLRPAWLPTEVESLRPR